MPIRTIDRHLLRFYNDPIRHVSGREPHGEWRSLVARLLWEQEAAGSNPVSPTRKGDLDVTDSTARISLYRRWRSKTFADIVGQEEIVRTLKNAVSRGETAHAYLFAGERGIGKTSIARILARAVNCLQPMGGEPCNVCDNCVTILANRSLDIVEIDGASNRGIDHIRRLREEVNFAPTDLRRKVYIIDEVHMLTNEAFNALLKTLEEPPPHAMFAFATTEPHKVPRTIVSRCQAFTFRRIPAPQIAEHLQMIAKAEGAVLSQEALRILSERANGGMRDAIVMLEQSMSYEGEEITADAILDMLGLTGHDTHVAFVEALIAGNRTQVLDLVGSLVESGKDLDLFLADVVTLLRDRVVNGAGGDTGDAIRLSQKLLDLKADLFRALDRRIRLEIGLLSMMPDPTVKVRQTPAASPTIQRDQQRHEEQPREETPAEQPRSRIEEQPKQAPKTTSGMTQSTSTPLPIGFEEKWRTLLKEVEQERIAIAAFLIEGHPHLDGERLILSFNPDHTFHKESLEKRQNMQYLAGVVRRHLGDDVRVQVQFDAEVERKPLPRELLEEKARLVCDAFEGRIVEEEG